MNEQTVTPGSVGVRYGIITGFISVLYSLILFITDLNTNPVLSNLSLLILLGGIIMAYVYFKKENMGFMSYGQGLGIGTLLSAISGLLSGIFVYIYVEFIDTGLVERMRNIQIEKMEEQGLSDEQIEQAMAMAEKFTGPLMMLVVTIIASAFFGFVFSLIVAAIMKRNRPEFE
ncbi:DUF4199 domain-containing protein [Sabulibacter ruber]|uniref:DUF4199 domain-containing protein n=1 Tax=Sabulibacter ruber TaxID=2811901 RepID=UPI001A9683A0|nr:DUF4199 domain-containing protein [Sabulibacter ruber]